MAHAVVLGSPLFTDANVAPLAEILIHTKATLDTVVADLSALREAVAADAELDLTTASAYNDRIARYQRLLNTPRELLREQITHQRAKERHEQLAALCQSDGPAQI